ncbi:MAG: glycosyltransferase family 2 protein [Ferruginibacter sp.]
MKTNIASVTVLYNPDKDFLSNIYSYANYVSLVILVDNSENPDPSFYTQLQKDCRVELIINRENKGIATALNQGIELAAINGFDWALTMDQDSFFEKAMIEKYIETFSRIPEKETVAVMGPMVEKNIQPGITEAIEVTSLITSGSLVNIPVFNKIGGYNEPLFIDEVDHEYCYRSKLKGFSILQLQHIFLQHTLGKTKNVTTISGKKNKSKTFHSPIRLYYIVRNSCYVIANYKKEFPAEMKVKRKDVLVRIKNNFLYGNDKIAVIKYVIRGFFDYKRKRFGKN